MVTDPQQAAEQRTELHALLLERSFRFGDFVLRSGARSSYYFDGKQVTLDGRGLLLVSTLLLQRCRDIGVAAVGGLTLGADPLAAGIALLSATDGGTPLRAFIVRKAVKDHGTQRAIEGPPLEPGTRVAVLDDVVSTGGATLEAIEQVQSTGAVVVEAMTVVDREMGGREAILERGATMYALFTKSEFPGTGDSA